MRLLVIGGGGGVGQAAIRLSKALTDWHVTATARRPASQAACQAAGADTVISHTDIDCHEENQYDVILCCTEPTPYWHSMATTIASEGRLHLIVDALGPVNLNRFKPKSVTIRWEFMFTRSHGSDEQRRQQGRILHHIAAMIDENRLAVPAIQEVPDCTVEHLTQAWDYQRTGQCTAKQVVLFQPPVK